MKSLIKFGIKYGILIAFFIALVGIAIYSFALIDPNLTLVNSVIWEQIREPFIQLGYYQRGTSWNIYLSLVIALFLFHLLLVKREKKIDAFKIGLMIGLATLISYPFLSHDFFNYMFDARILTLYGQNPYLHKALDFPQDDWLRFMHWTHRPYPYGPSYLIFTLIPSYLSGGKFITDFFLFKLLNITFYLVGIFYLKKIVNKIAIIFATHPLVIIEGLINGHNDLIATSLGIIGVYFVLQSNEIRGRIFMLLSAGIKYITAPILLLINPISKNNRMNFAVILIQICLVVFLVFRSGFQPWYFLTFFIFLPLYPNLISKFNIFTFGLLVSYYPYIFLGGWDTAEKVGLKNTVIYVFFVINVLFILSKNLLSLTKLTRKIKN